MLSDDPNNAGISPIHSRPPHTATGEFDIRGTSVPNSCFEALDDIEHRVGLDGRREALAVLLEYYYRYPSDVVGSVELFTQAERTRSLRVRGVHKRHRKLLYDLSVELSGASDSYAVEALCRHYMENTQEVITFANGLLYR